METTKKMKNSNLVLKVRSNKVMWLENGKLLLKVAYADNSTAQMIKHNHSLFCFTEKGEAEFGYCFNNLFHYEKVYFNQETKKSLIEKGIISKDYVPYNVDFKKGGKAVWCNSFRVIAEVVYQHQDTDIQRYNKEKALKREAAPKKWYVHYDGVLSFGQFAYGVDNVYDDDEVFDTEAEMLQYVKSNYPEWAEQYGIQ